MDTLATIGRRDTRIGAVAESARRNGIENVGIVGGYVRDALLGGEPRDLDVVVEGLTPEFVNDLADRLGGTVKKASEFGTYTIGMADGEDVDVATARTETYERPAALPTVTPGSFAEDMARRDFTVNAMAFRVETDGSLSLYDPVGGVADLEGGTIRVLHDDSFADDPTRIVRAVRYAVRLDFSIEPHTGALMDEAIDSYLSLLTPARIGAELRRTWECEQAADVFYELVGHHVFKALDAKLETSPMACVAARRLAASDHPRDLAFAAAAGLMAGVGLMLSADDSAPRRVADRLGMGKAEARVLMDTAAQYPHIWTLFDDEAPPSEKRKLLGLACRLAVEAWEAWDGQPSALTAYLRSLDQTEAPSLNGHDLMAAGVPRGPLIGEVLRRLSDARLDGEVRSRGAEVALVAAALDRLDGESGEGERS